jgi:predicted molibdopterin-dependent oxidoreductase YjgC
MAHVIVQEKLYNEAFIRQRTEGFEAFAASLDKFTPEFAEAVSGVDRERIAAAARLYARAERGAIYWGMGISQLSQGTASALGLIHLALLTGHVGREGTGLNPLRGQNNVQGASDCGAMPFHYPGYMEVDDEANARQWERAWNVEPGGLSRKRGLTTTEILANAHPGGVRALYIMGENPMMTEPNLNVTREHLRALEFLAVQDLFINETAAYADVFLPACSWAEKDGTFTNTDRRVQRVRAAVGRRGQARPDWEILCDLARRIEARLGRPHSASWEYAAPEQVFREMAEVATMLKGVTYARIEKVGLQYPVPDESHPGTPFLFAESFPSGRGRFFPLEYVPVAEPPDDEFPFILTTGRLLEHWHGGTMTRHSQLDALYPEAFLEVHEIDATQLGLKDGDSVRVASRRGAVRAHVHISPKTTPGVVFLPMHFHEAAANLLTVDALDAEAKIPEFKACAVSIQIARPESQPPLRRGRY